MRCLAEARPEKPTLTNGGIVKVGRMRNRSVPVRPWMIVSLLALAGVLAACNNDSGNDTVGAGEDRAVAEVATTDEGGDIAEALSGDMEIIVPFGPGGTYDLVARQVQNHLPDYLPGDQRITVQNVPGADTVNGARRVVDAPPDGTTLFHYGPQFLELPEFLGEEFPGLNATEQITPLGSVVDDTVDEHFTCVRTDVATNVDEAFKVAEETGEELTLSFQVGTPLTLFMDYLEGFPFDVVYGYSGTAESFQAVDNKEVDGTAFCHMGGILERAQHWVEEDYVQPMFMHFGMSEQMQQFFDEAGWETPPSFAEVLEERLELTEAESGYMELLEVQQNIPGYVFGTGSQVPEATQEQISDALEEMAKSEDFQEAMRSIERFAGWTPGEEIQSSLKKLRGFPEEVNELAAEFMLRD